MVVTWVGAGQKFDFFVKKSLFFCNSKHFSQNIMTSCYSYYCCIFYVFHFFKIIKVSLFFARYDQDFIIFKDSNLFEFTNFPFKTKFNNTVVYSVTELLILEGKTRRKKMLKQFFD